MAKATTTRQTRVLIGEAMHRGRTARDAIETFAVAAIAALDSFDADTARYKLDDDAYERFEKDSGAFVLLHLATEMEDRLYELAEQRR